MNMPHSKLFRTITIHGLVATQDELPTTIVLDRKPSFPQPFFQGYIDRHPPPEDISPLPIVGRLDLEVRVVVDSASPHETGWIGAPPGALGYGRAGSVYPLQVLSMRRANQPSVRDGKNGAEDATNTDIPSLEDLPPLCIKIGTPTYARRLAREAWFYERLDTANMTGIMSPRCYGVFSAPMVQTEFQPLSISLPGYDYQEQVKANFKYGDPWTACLPEETEYSKDEGDAIPTVGPQYLDDPKGSHATSPWLGMRERGGEPTLTVLVMDKLGGMLTYDDFDRNEHDIDQMFDHLLAMNIDHGDARFRNILRAPDTATVICPEHQKRHKWVLVDWEDARMMLEFSGREVFLKDRSQFKMFAQNPHLEQD